MSDPQSLIGTECLNDEQGMRMALALARQAAVDGEVPVGAVMVQHGRVIAEGRNAPIAQHDPTAHAEIVALRSAAQSLGNYRLEDCTLYVTLEPCPMCAGAMLHARLPRVVFGAADPRTGAAGSVVNLFSEPLLNHHTQIQGGVLADECSLSLSQFFQQRRREQREEKRIAHPLREDALRVPDKAFAQVPDYPWQARYVSDLPALDGLRLHYLDEGSSTAQRTWLLVHGLASWSFEFRHLIPALLAAGDRVIAVDLPGFGKSDQPKKEAAHSERWHAQVIQELIGRLNLRGVVLVAHGLSGHVALGVPLAAPERFAGLLALNTWLPEVGADVPKALQKWCDALSRKPRWAIGEHVARMGDRPSALEIAAWDAPFPDPGHRAALRAFAGWALESKDPSFDREVLDFWQQHWQGKTLLVAGANDALLGANAMHRMQRVLHQGTAQIDVIPGLGHFLSQHGANVALRAVEYFSPF